MTGAGPNSAILDFTDTDFAAAYRALVEEVLIEGLTPAQYPKGAYLDAYNASVHIGAGTVNYNPVQSPQSGGDNTNGSPWLAAITADLKAFRSQMRTNVDSEFFIIQENNHPYSLASSDLVSHKDLASPFGLIHTRTPWQLIYGEYVESITLVENGFRSRAEIGQPDFELLAPDALAVSLVLDFCNGMMFSLNHVPYAVNFPNMTEGWSEQWEDLFNFGFGFMRWDRVLRIKQARRWGEMLRPIPGGATDGLNEEVATAIATGTPADGVFRHPDGTSLIVVFANYDFMNNVPRSGDYTLAASEYPFIVSGVGGLYDVVEYDQDQLGGTTPLLSNQSGDLVLTEFTVSARGSRVIEIIPQ